MKLSDVVGHAGLAIYAEVALVIFAAAFVAVVFQLLGRNQRLHEHQAQLPLADDVVAPRRDAQ